MDYKEKYYALKRAMMVINVATASAAVDPSINKDVVGHCWGIAQTALGRGEGPAVERFTTEWRQEMYKKYNEKDF